MKTEEGRGGLDRENGAVRLGDMAPPNELENKDDRNSGMQNGLFKGVSRVWDGGKEAVGDVLARGERLVQRNPAVSVLGCCIGGGVIGLIAGWLLAKEEREARAFTYKFLRRWGGRLSLENWHI